MELNPEVRELSLIEDGIVTKTKEYHYFGPRFYFKPIDKSSMEFGQDVPTRKVVGEYDGWGYYNVESFSNKNVRLKKELILEPHNQ